MSGEHRKASTSRSERKVRKDYRLILQEEGSFAEKWALRVRPGQLKWLAAAVIMLVVLITYATVALTPLKEWVVPGYLSTETRKMQQEAWALSDSLSQELDRQARFLDNMIAVIEGRVPREALMDTAVENNLGTPDEIGLQSSASLNRLRDEVEEEDAFALSRSGGLDDAGLWLSPVDGRVSSSWNPAEGHWGVDLVAPENSPVKAVGAGTVIYSGYTVGGGNTVMVQHPGNRVSIYMHNSRLEVSTGDAVQRGDVLAIIGNSGDHSTGPHLHFEWWESGVPVDPTLRVSL